MTQIALPVTECHSAGTFKGSRAYSQDHGALVRPSAGYTTGGVLQRVFWVAQRLSCRFHESLAPLSNPLHAPNPVPEWPGDLTSETQ